MIVTPNKMYPVTGKKRVKRNDDVKKKSKRNKKKNRVELNPNWIDVFINDHKTYIVTVNQEWKIILNWQRRNP